MLVSCIFTSINLQVFIKINKINCIYCYKISLKMTVLILILSSFLINDYLVVVSLDFGLNLFNLITAFS